MKKYTSAISFAFVLMLFSCNNAGSPTVANTQDSSQSYIEKNLAGYEKVRLTTDVSELTEKEKQQFAMGRKFYLSTCSACHGNDGEGLNRFAPPLKGSEWVLGDEKRLALIVLHGACDNEYTYSQVA